MKIFILTVTFGNMVQYVEVFSSEEDQQVAFEQESEDRGVIVTDVDYERGRVELDDGVVISVFERDLK